MILCIYIIICTTTKKKHNFLSYTKCIYTVYINTSKFVSSPEEQNKYDIKFKKLNEKYTLFLRCFH